MKRLISLMLALLMLGSCFALADGNKDSRAVIGADLDDADIEAVYSMFGIKRGDVTELEVTNKDERQYLEGQVDEKLIGSRSISCVYIEVLEEGKGLNVSVKNITWCTPDMYMNAMVTAGITDADVKIAAPFGVSGTAALTGIYMAYEDVTGEKLDEDAKLVGTKELTLTAELADAIGSADSTAIVNELKLMIDEIANMSDEEIRTEIEKLADKYGVTLNDSQIEKLIDLCHALGKLDVSVIKEKVEQVQSYLRDLADKGGNVKEFLLTVADTVTELVTKVIDFFRDLFAE